RERAELLDREQSARAEAASAWEHLSFLMRAGNLVAATRNPDELLEQVTQLVVPQLADYCVAFMPTRDGELCAASLTHEDPEAAKELSRLRDHPFPSAGPLITQRAYTTATTQLARDYSATTQFW